MALPTLVGITLVTFLVSHLLPADLVLINLGVDMLYAVLDPRIRY